MDHHPAIPGYLIPRCRGNLDEAFGWDDGVEESEESRCEASYGEDPRDAEQEIRQEFPPTTASRSVRHRQGAANAGLIDWILAIAAARSSAERPARSFLSSSR